MLRHTLAAGLSLSLLASVALGEPPKSFEPAARQLQSAVSTLRIVTPGKTKQPSVTVCSGVAVGSDLVITSTLVAGGARPKITFPGGAQSEAEVRVIDEYSGLALLRVEGRKLKPLPLAKEPPSVGAWVLGAAGWAGEPPVISFGIVSGVRRALPASTFPPLLQCDLRAASTSAGGPIVDQHHRLLGVIVAVDVEKNKPGWTYAVPVEHVRRLMRLNAEQTKANPNLKTPLILKRKRPRVGMMLDQQNGKVVVRRVTENSPASRAGIRVGDEILAAEMVEIRSVYQAVRPLISKQAGDTVTYLVKSGEGSRQVRVLLDSGDAIAARPGGNADLAQPRLDIERLKSGGVRSRSGLDPRVFGDDDEKPAVEKVPSVTADAKIRLLEKAVEAYRNALQYQQREITRLRKEVERLRKK